MAQGKDGVEMSRFDELLLLTDERFFGLLDLGGEELGAVGAAVAGGDFEAARSALVHYYQQLADTPFGPLPPMDERTDAPLTPDGEEALRHQISNWGQTVQLPEQIPWLRPELSHPSRGDYHVVSALNEHGLMRRLVDAYRETGNSRYARHAIDLVCDWLKTCTPFPRDPSAYSDRTAVWYNPAHSTRVANWTYAFYALRHCSVWTDDERIALLKAIFREQELKRDNYQGNPNHIINQLLGFVRFGTWWPEFEVAQRWAAEALGKLRLGLDDFYYPDGAYVELCYMHGDMVEACRLAREHGYPIAADFAEQLAHTFDFPLYAMHPRGGYPPWNDSGGRCREAEPLPERMGWLVGLGAEFTGRDDLRYVDSWGSEGQPPAHTSHYFPYAGMFFMRSDWTPRARYLAFDGGRNLGGYQHPHMDQLSFILAAYGHTLVTDTGYGGPWHGRWRQEYYVATPGHNAIAVDGQWQAQYPEAHPEENQRWNTRPMIGNLWSVSPGLVARGISPEPIVGNRWLSDEYFDYARSAYDQGFTRDPQSPVAERLQVVHERRVLFLKPDYWIITDFLEGDGEYEFEAYFHFAAAAEAEVGDGRVALRHLEAELQLVPLCVQPIEMRIVCGQREPIQGWLPDDWGTHQPAPTGIISGKVQLPLTLHTVLFPAPVGQMPAVEVGFFGEGDDPAIEVVVEGRRDLYRASRDSSDEYRVGEWTFAGETAAIRLDEQGEERSRFGAF